MHRICAALALWLSVGVGGSLAQDTSLSTLEAVGEIRDSFKGVPRSVFYCGPYFFGVAGADSLRFIVFNIKQTRPPPPLGEASSSRPEDIFSLTMDIPVVIHRDRINWIDDPGATIPYAIYYRKKDGVSMVDIRMSFQHRVEASCLASHALEM